jgi:hypothetical protein
VKEVGLQSRHATSGLKSPAPQISDFSSHLNALSCNLNLKTPGDDRQHQERDLGDEILKEFFCQLWVILGLEKVRVPNPNRDRGCLVWVREDLVREKNVGIEDCFPVRKVERFAGVPT